MRPRLHGQDVGVAGRDRGEVSARPDDAPGTGAVAAASHPLVQAVSSRDNPAVKVVRRLVEQPTAYRRTGQVWLEGEHLCEALRTRGGRPARALISQAGWAQPRLASLAAVAPRVDVLPDALFAQLGGMPSPASLGFLVDLPAAADVLPACAAVLLDRVQDAGNVGSILRTAAAMGVPQVLATVGTAALWSPKVLRAGMGAHFGLRLIEGLQASDLDALAVPWVAGSSHARADLTDTALPDPCVWVMGHEGQGVSAEVMRRCSMTVRIPQPGGEESLNVAAAAAICLYESARQRRGASRA